MDDTPPKDEDKPKPKAPRGIRLGLSRNRPLRVQRPSLIYRGNGDTVVIVPDAEAKPITCPHCHHEIEKRD